MKGLDGGFIFNGGKNIVDRYGRTEMEPRRTVEEPRWNQEERWKNRDGKMCFMFLKSEEEVTTVREGLLGWRVLARF